MGKWDLGKADFSLPTCSNKDGQPNHHSLYQQDGHTNPITALHPSIAYLGVISDP